MSSHADPAKLTLKNALYLNETGHFFDMPEHFMFRNKPRDFLVWVILGGRGFVTEDKVRHDVGAGDMVTLVPRVPHAYGSDLREPWSILWAHFDGLLAQEYAMNLRLGAASGSRSGPVVHVGVDPLIRDRFVDLILLRQTGGTGTDLRCRGEFHALLSLLVQRVRRFDQAAHGSPGFDVPSLEAHIHQHLATPITLDDLAGRAHLSVTHFSRQFRKHYHVSPMQYVTQARMARACAMLRETQAKVVHVAQTVGYDDPYYFSRLFRKTVGVSPRAFRQGEKAYEPFRQFVFNRPDPAQR